MRERPWSSMMAGRRGCGLSGIPEREAGLATGFLQVDEGVPALPTEVAAHSAVDFALFNVVVARGSPTGIFADDGEPLVQDARGERSEQRPFVPMP